MRCPSCGREVSAEPFCEWCGKSLNAEKAPPIELKSATPSASKPLTPVPSLEESNAVPQATPSAKAKEKPENAGRDLQKAFVAPIVVAIALFQKFVVFDVFRHPGPKHKHWLGNVFLVREIGRQAGEIVHHANVEASEASFAQQNFQLVPAPRNGIAAK